MTEKIQSIPARIKNIAKGGHVAGTEDIIDDASGKTQKEINTETGNKVDALQKQDIEAVTSLPAVSSADPKKIYRVAGETSYTDYMLNAAGTQFVAIATYSFPGIDDEPTAGSSSLVRSGGVWNDSTVFGTNKLGWTDRKINTTTGEISASSDRKLSELIDITKYTPYTVVSNSALRYCVCYFDVNKDFISGEGWIYSKKNLTNDAPQGTVYVRIMVGTDNVKYDYENLYVYNKGTWFGENIGDIIFQNVLPQETIQESAYFTAEVGKFNIDGSYDSRNSYFRLHNPIESYDLISISCVSGYKLTIYGNNEGLNHPITQLNTWVTNYDIPYNAYKYYFVIGKRDDGAMITSADDLTSIILVAQNISNGEYVPAASKEQIRVLSNTIQQLITEFDTNLIVVDAKGKGDYTSLQDAINNAGDSAEQPKTIIVMPGTYVMTEYTDRTKAENRYLSIIGTDKNNCIVRNDVGYYTTGPYVDNAPLKLAGNVYVANLTIISTDTNYPSDGAADRHKAYCIHLDFNAPQGTCCEINNCVLINNHFSCIGFGLRPNYTIKIVNCELTATMNEGNGLSSYGTLYGHDGGSGSTTQIEQHLFVKGCVITNTNGNYGIKYINAHDYLVGLTLINNVIDTPDGTNGFRADNTATKTKRCFGNNINNMNYQ